MSVGDWFTGRFDIGEWNPIRWQFFVGLLILLLSPLAYMILKAIFMGVLKIIDKVAPTMKADDDIKQHCTRPVCFIGLIIVWFIVVAFFDFPSGVKTTFDKILTLLLFICLGLLGLGIITVISKAVLRNGTWSDKEVQSVRWVTKILQAVWIVLWTLFALDNLKVNINILVAYSVVAVACLGYAARDVVRNFYGGLRVAFAKPFERGDHIKIELKRISVEGTEAKVGLSDTTIQSTEGYLVIVPNYVFANTALINFNKQVEVYNVVSEEEALDHNPLTGLLKKKVCVHVPTAKL
eukprot:NODE_549_length_1574_cov_83.629508_g399_i0.p1 GENE.NODE_549_length_1574_cov_83.629508_g399_i0~~NODE_549_length_1574_cov_83.629508_g399_i0.p1  ORF type:complete len:294 (-),score=63.14 NODE_549_length_1574_cov_83.629508_g399_i0:632-1513(-)